MSGSMIRRLELALLVALAGLPAIFADNIPYFSHLGYLPGGTDSWALATSADGSVAVGRSSSSNSGSNWEAFRWTSSAGMVGLGDLPGGNFFSTALGVSGDGSVVTGFGSLPNYKNHAFRWTASTGMVDLGAVYGANTSSIGLAISADGSTIVGSCDNPAGNPVAFRWTQATGMQAIVTNLAEATGVSADGSWVSGTHHTDQYYYQAFRWTPGSLQDCGVLPGYTDSYGLAISDDGTTAVGVCNNGAATPRQAFRWTAAAGMQALGHLPGQPDSWPYAASADGSVVVGTSNDRAFIWDAQHGMRSLQGVLEDQCHLDLTGWVLDSASGLSDDGLTVVGYGFNPQGRPEAFVARIPEPSAGLLAVLAAATLTRRRVA
jgi:probable HAF family extracellular repeat protein